LVADSTWTISPVFFMRCSMGLPMSQERVDRRPPGPPGGALGLPSVKRAVAQDLANRRTATGNIADGQRPDLLISHAKAVLHRDRRGVAEREERGPLLQPLQHHKADPLNRQRRQRPRWQIVAALPRRHLPGRTGAGTTRRPSHTTAPLHRQAAIHR
jgi:hypothetical protein